MSVPAPHLARSAIHWPYAFDPARSALHVVNRLDIAAAPEAVWSALIAATRWPLWYANSADVHIDGDGEDLSPGVGFRWQTFGFTLGSVVQEFVPNERLAWLATGPGIRAYHAWLIIPQPGGCLAITEESQNGAMPRIGRFLLRGRILKWHQTWLEGLELQASR